MQRFFFALCGAAALSVLALLAPAPVKAEAARATTKWEYKCLAAQQLISPGASFEKRLPGMEEKLNALGAEGWEIAFPPSQVHQNMWASCFKRLVR